MNTAAHLARRNALAAALGRPPVGWPTHTGLNGRDYPSAWFPCARCDGTVPCRHDDVDVGLVCRACRDELLVAASTKGTNGLS